MRGRGRRACVLTGALLALTWVGAAGPLAAEARFRADDGSLWQVTDNPALEAVRPDPLAAGYRWAPGTWDLALSSPLASFRFGQTATGTVLSTGLALGPWAGVATGYRRVVVSGGPGAGESHQFGLLARPWDLASLGLTLDNAFSGSRVWGAGLALRPLAFTGSGPWGEALTLTGDVTWSAGGLRWQEAGLRLAWQGSHLRVWYDLASPGPGVELIWALGPAETSASATSFTEAPSLGTALRFTRRQVDTGTLGAWVLRVRGTGPAPSLGQSPAEALADLLTRAARTSSLKAVAIEDPAEVAGLASAQTLAAALAEVRKAGKTVYVHADSVQDGLGFQGWLSAADRLSLDPNGSVDLRSGSVRRLYLKGLLDSLGVSVVNLAPWDTKSANNAWAYAAMPDGERAMLRRYLTDREAQTRDALSAGRGQRLAVAPDVAAAEGPYLSARAALAAGLVDALENRADFEASLRQIYPGAQVRDDLPPPDLHPWGPPVAGRTAALVRLSGDLIGGPGAAGRSIGRLAAEALRDLRDDAGIAAVVLVVDSPGGAVLPSDTLADEVRKTVAAGKPVLVVMGDVAASGGYYLSAPATRIWARPGTLTGSIGVTAAVLTAAKALKTLGVQPDGVDLGPSAAFGDWTRDPASADRARWDQWIRETYDRFLDVVAAGRHLDRERLEPLARGQIYTGREAQVLGLVDELGGLTEARAWLEKSWGGPVTWREVVPGEQNPWAGLLGPVALTLGLGAPGLPAVLDRWAAPVLKELSELEARGPGPLVWTDVSPRD